MTNKAKKLWRQALGLIPTKLPTGMTEFNEWADDILNNYDLPTTDADSVKFTLSTIIMHLGPHVDRKPKLFFVKTLRAAAAKQVAGAVFTDIKLRQKELEEKKAAAADAIQSVS